MTASPPRIAVVQPAMRWSAEDNVQTMLQSLVIADAEGAALCVFPELAVTGFHRRIVDHARPGSVDVFVQRLSDACAAHGVAATFGAPTFPGDGGIRNSQLFIDADGALLATVDKRGLTAAEATFFAPGTSRPVFDWRGLRCTSVICREVEDHDSLLAELDADRPDLVFWPGLMSPEAGSEPVEPPRHVQQAQRLARSLAAFVVQSNWPNALNYPETSPLTGHSACIAADGELLWRLPRGLAGLGVFTLGERSFEWHALPLEPATAESGAA